jgi:hypothetical protein
MPMVHLQRAQTNAVQRCGVSTNEHTDHDDAMLIYMRHIAPRP